MLGIRNIYRRAKCMSTCLLMSIKSNLNKLLPMTKSPSTDDIASLRSQFQINLLSGYKFNRIRSAHMPNEVVQLITELQTHHCTRTPRRSDRALAFSPNPDPVVDAWVPVGIVFIHRRSNPPSSPAPPPGGLPPSPYRSTTCVGSQAGVPVPQPLCARRGFRTAGWFFSDETRRSGSVATCLGSHGEWCRGRSPRQSRTCRACLAWPVGRSRSQRPAEPGRPRGPSSCSRQCP